MAEPFIVGSSLNQVEPARPRPPLPDRDERDHALRRFADFLAALVYRRTANPNEPAIGFKVPRRNIHIYQPDDIVNAAMPGFGIVPGRGRDESLGLGPAPICEDSYEVYAPGTALMHTADYVEQFTLEVWGSKHAERRALVAGVKAVLNMSDTSTAIRLKLPDYYNRVATFMLDDSQYIDGDEVARNRRRAQLFITMTVPKVQLVNVVPMRVQLITRDARPGIEVLDGNVNPSVDC